MREDLQCVFGDLWGRFLPLLALLLAVPPPVAMAGGPADYEIILRQNRLFDSDYDDKPWAEVEAQLPKAPEAANLVPIYVGPTTRNSFAIDRQSVTFGSDEVVRYTLVVTSPGGARNVSYEGMRCATGERRLYAFGRPDGSWSKARSNAWERIENNTLNRHHSALYSDYFCTVGGSVSSTESARSVLVHGNPAATMTR